ncbi:MAG: glycosyltransferase, partial [Elusimicrobiota bacterium]
MKVTIITREYPPNVYGGAGVHAQNLSQELSKLMEVEVRCFGNQDWQKNNLRVKGYKPLEKLKEIPDKKFVPALDTLSTDLSILKDRIDSAVVHTHTWYASFAGYLAKMLYGIPLVVTCHSLEPLRPWKLDQLGRGYYLSTWVEKLAIESADKIVAVSQMMKEDIMKYFNV